MACSSDTNDKNILLGNCLQCSNGISSYFLRQLRFSFLVCNNKNIFLGKIHPGGNVNINLPRQLLLRWLNEYPDEYLWRFIYKKTFTFRDIIVSPTGREICSSLVDCLIQRYLGDSATTDAISAKLREVRYRTAQGKFFMILYSGNFEKWMKDIIRQVHW